MTEVRRIDPETGFIREFKEVAQRVASLETRPAGNIVIRETLMATDPETGVKTIIGQLPDGTVGFQPFVGDIVPPPVATAPVATAQPGTITVTWDGEFVGGAEKPNDFQHVNVRAHKILTGTTVLSLTVGVIRLASETVIVTTDVLSYGETWEFSLESEDYNGNRAALSARSAPVAVLSGVDDSTVGEALAELADAAQAAQEAAEAAQDSAAAAQDDADDAAAAALAAANLADSKGVVYTQSATPSADYSGLWIDTAHNNVPRRYLGTRKALAVNYSGGSGVVSGRLSSLGWSVSAVTGTPTLGEASQYDLVVLDAGYNALGTTAKTLAAELHERGISMVTTGNDTSSLLPLFSGTASRGTPKNNIRWISAGSTGPSSHADYADSDLALYITGVNAAAKVSGTMLVTSTGVDQPVNLIMEHATNFSRWAHVQTYNTPAGPLNSHIGWVSDNWVAIQDQGIISAASAAASAQITANQAFNNAADAADAAGTAQDTANGKGRLWYQDAEPAGIGHNIGDTWFDTNDNYKIRTWNGFIWQTTQDAFRAQQTADSKGITYTQSVVPPVEARLPQNLWNDTSLGLDKVVTKYWSTTANAWTPITDKEATEARVIADSKGETIYSSTEPTIAQRLSQNLWIDTTGGINISKRWDGSGWVVVADTRIASTATAVTAADAKAQDAFDEAIAKSTVYTQNFVPPVEARLPQTIWNDTSLGLDKVVVKYWSTTAGAWTALADKEATEARVVADAKGETIYGTSEPDAAKRLSQNLWIDTTGGINISKRWDGSGWVVVADTRIASTATAVTAVDAKADTKSIVYTQSVTPPVSARLPQTLWNDTSLGLNNVVVKYWDGDSWEPLADKTATDAALAAGYAQTATAYSQNPSFDEWPSTVPAGFVTWSSTVYTKDTTNKRVGPHSLQMTAPTNPDLRGIQFSSTGILSHAPNLEYFTVEVDFMLQSGTGLGGAGLLLDWSGLTPSRTNWSFSDTVSGTPILGKWYRITKTLRRPTGATGTWTAMSGFLMANYGSNLGTLTAKTINYDWLNIRPATTEEITAYGAPGKYTELETATAAKGEVIYSDSAPAASKQLAQNLWVDTTGGLNLHKRWIGGSGWVTVTDSRIALSLQQISTLTSQVSAVSAQADRSISTFYGTSTPSAPESGDLWLTGVAGEPMKRYDGSQWLAFEDPNVQAAYEKAGDAQAAADAKVRTWAQDAEPAGMVPDDIGDLWIDTDDKNRLYRYDGDDWIEVRDDTIADAQGTANAALSTASSAVSAANTAQSTADGKNTSYYQNDQPSGGTYKVGDLWFDTNDSYKMRTYAGSGVWQLTQDSAGAITTAAQDATTKADAAQMAAIAAQAYSLNPSFEDWTGTYPTSYAAFNTAPTKETTIVRTGKNAMRFNCTDSTTQRGVTFHTALAHAPNLDYFTLELDVRLDSGSTFAGSGVLLDWAGMTNQRVTVSLATEIPAPVVGKWYRVVKVLKKPANATGTWTAMNGWLMGQYSSGMGTMSVKNVIFDWLNVRPSTTEEVTAYGTPASITALNDVLVTKTKSWWQAAKPSLTGNTNGDLWFDTDDGNKIYIWNTTANDWLVAQDAAISSLNTAVTAAQASANGKNKVIYSTSAASGTTGYVAGDTWFQRDGAGSVIAMWEFTTSWQSRTVGNDVVAANLNAGKITAGTLSADRIASNSLSANKVFVGDFTNLAADGSFASTSKINWTGSGTVTVSAGQPNTLRVVTAASGNNDQANVNTIQVTPGEQIYGEVYVYGEPTNVGGGGPNMHLTVIDNNGTMSWPTFQSYGRATVSGVWTKISGKLTMPANAKTAKVELAVSYAADAVGNVYHFREVSVRRMATGNLIVDGAITAGSAIIETGAIGNAHIGNLAVGTAEIQDLAVETAKIDDLAITNAKIDDLAVTNAKIANATIQAAKIGSIDAGTITVGLLSGAQISATAIDGKTITGATVQTESTANRGIKLTSAELAGYDNTGTKNFSLSSAGVLAIKGLIKSGSTIEGTVITGTEGVQTSSTPLRGIKITNTGVSAFDNSGNMTFRVDGTTGTVDAPGIRANSIDGDKIVARSIEVDKLTVADFSNYVENPGFETGDLTGWDVVGGWFINTASPHAGTYKALTQYTGVLQSITNKMEVTLPVGGKVRVKFRLYAESPTSGNMVTIALYNSVGGALESVTNIAQTGNWVEIDRELTAATAGAKRLQISTTGAGAGSYVRLDSIVMNRMVNGELIVDGAIDGKVITGATIQTEATANRGIKLTSTELAGYDGAGVKNLSLTSAGVLTLKGAIQSGSTITGATLTGAGIETTATAARGVKLTSTGITTYDSSGNMTFKVDATTGLVEAPGLKANSITGTMIAGSTITAKNLFVGDFANLATIDELNGITVSSYGQTQIVGGYNTLVTDSGAFFMFTDQRGPVPFDINDTLYYEFTAKAASATTVNFGVWTYDAAGNNTQTVSTAINVGTTDTLVKQELKVTSYRADAKTFVVGLQAVANKGIQLKDVKVYKKFGGNLIVDGAIDGKVITGATIQTEATANRGIKLTSTELAGYDGAGVKNLSLTSAGVLTLKGAIQSGSTITGATLTGAGIETTATALRGVKISSTGINTYDSSGNLTFKVDATTGEVEAPGIKANSIKGDKLEIGSITADKLLISSTPNAIVDPAFLNSTITTFRSTASTGTWTTVAGTATVPASLSHTTGTTNDLFLAAPFTASSATKANAIPVKQGQKWLLEVDVETNISAGVRWNLHRWHSDGTFTYVSASPFNTGTGKRTLSYVYEVPAGVVAIYPSLACNTTGVVWKVYGNLVLSQQVGTTLIADGAVTTDHMTVGTIDAGVLTAGTLTANKLAAKSVGIDQLMISSSDNLVTEASFEHPLTPGSSWTRGTNQIIQAGGGRDGGNAMRLTGTTSINYTYNLSNKVMVDDDNRFRVSMWVKTNVAYSSDKIRVGVKPYKGTTVLSNVALFRNSSNSASANYVPGTNVWTQIQGVSDPLPAGTTAVEWFINSTAPSTTAYVDIDAISVTRANDGTLIVDGSITADKLEAELILATKIVAGDPDGTHAEMSPQGFRVYADGAEEGAPSTEVVRLGVADTNDYFAITKADGSLAASISQDGVISGSTVYATDDIYYKGESLSTQLARLPRGPLYKAELSSDVDNITTNYGLVEGEFISDGTDRQIQFDFGLKLFPTPGLSEVYLKLMYTVDGSAPTVNSPQIFDVSLGTHASSTSFDYKSFTHTIRPTTMNAAFLTPGTRGRFLMVIMRGNGDTLRPRAGLQTFMYITDIGPGIPHIPNFSPGGGSNPAPPPPVPAQQTYVKQYGCYNSMNYQGNNNQYNFDLGRMYQGLSPAGYGNLKSIGLFDRAAIQADLSGASINYVRVYFNFAHWYYNSGGTARIGVHNHTGIPGTFSSLGPLSVISGGWPKPGARWVDLSSSHWEGWKNGYGGVYLEGDGGYGTYGYADRPTLEISYTK